MKKFYLSLAVSTLVCAWFVFGSGILAQLEKTTIETSLVSPNLVISQFQPGTSASVNDEFVEIHNSGAAAVDLNGYRLVYRSQNGVADVGPFAVWTTSTVLQPGQYYLVTSTSYSGSATADITYNPATCACSMSAANGHLGIRQGDMNTGDLIDAVGWGTGAAGSLFEGTRTVAPGSGNSQARKQNGCQDTDNNANDFATLVPFAPRNTSTSPVVCSGGGTTLFAAINANPTTVTPPGNTLLTVTVIPATTPPSTGITVVSNLSDLFGSASQPFFDNGTNGDVTAGDNVFSYSVTVPAGTPGSTRNVTAVASDAQARTVNLNQSITINAPLPNEDPLLFGNPSNATSDVANENNYLMQKPQYSLSYSRARAIPNWTAWHLDSSWIGTTPRQDDFRPDTTLPAGWYQVLETDYSGSGFQRGHMCPSGDRTNSIPNNSATFLMTNIVPQFGPNNEGPWADLENYLRSVAQQGNEIYIIAGPQGSHLVTPTIAGGRIAVPKFTWKVVIVLPNGGSDLQRVSHATRVFGVIMSNESISQSAPWRNFRVTVDAVENLTGYNFFSAIPKNIQELIERKRDTQ